MFRKYEKTYRINIPEITVKGKFFLSKKDAKKLLAGWTIVEEKLDGANIGIIKHKGKFHLQKRGSLVAQSEHAQYGYLYNWAYHQNYDKLLGIPDSYIVYGELMYSVHNIFYDSLPDYVIVIDVWNGKNYLNREQKEEFCEKHDLAICPLVDEGRFRVGDLFSLIPKKSAFGERIEGIVVKKHRKKDFMKGKIVLREFQKAIEGGQHWMRKPMEKNIIKKEKNNE